MTRKSVVPTHFVAQILLQVNLALQTVGPVVAGPGTLFCNLHECQNCNHSQRTGKRPSQSRRTVLDTYTNQDASSIKAAVPYVGNLVTAGRTGVQQWEFSSGK